MLVTATDALAELTPAGLDEVNAIAALQARVDRKYVLTPAQLDALLERVGDDARVLEIDGRRDFGYESVYFDTPDLAAYHLSAHRRRTRFKVRTRSYLDTGTCGLEVKLRDPRGVTHKFRHAHPIADRARLLDDSFDFLAGFPPLTTRRDELRPTLITNYRRATLLIGTSRATLDFDVACRRPGPSATAGFAGKVIVETKCPRGPGALDRLLWDLHARPVTVSKYGTGLAALRPDLPNNKWHRTLQSHVEVTEPPVC